MSSLTEKLKVMGVKVGTADLPPPMPVERYEIDAVVTGSYRSTALGDVFVSEQLFEKSYHHGMTPFLPSAQMGIIAQWAGQTKLAELPLERFVFLDTETSGLAGGTGTLAFLVGVGRFVDDHFLLQQYFMRDPAEESALLEGLADFLAPAEALVTFNGKAFDAPLLVTRYTMHRIPVPFKGYAHLDLLPLARRLWRDRLPSRALKYIEEHVLGMTRSTEEVPGYEIPWLYFDYLRSGDARPLEGVFYHNAMDVVALAALLAHTSSLTSDPYSGRVQHGLDFVALAKLYEDLGHWDHAARLYELGLQSGLSTQQNEELRIDPPNGLGKSSFSISDFDTAVKRLSILHKRRGDLEQAVQLWQTAAGEGHIYAYVELAKYYEHRLRDVKSATSWTVTALKELKKSDLPTYVCKYWRAELEHRLDRLKRKGGL
ncbi:MAG: hypothetical protein A2Y54_09410 [Chloroflexi bacterium RBG_16_51_16]|nr:MAG: hypothetical protein A2Y54_09410 [Chloroflexi bacterium RBG_16_51_16]